MNAKGNLAGKAALVTGGSRGIGAAIARRLAREGAGVAITFSRGSTEAGAVVRDIEKEGGRAVAIAADAVDAGAVLRSVDESARVLGRLDILVNNAGIAIIRPMDEITLAEFDRIVAVNVRAPFVAAQAAARHMKTGGRIINIGSVNSDLVPFRGGAAYALSKGAVAGLTRGLARDLGPRGITVLNVQPGPVETDMNPSEGAFAEEAKRQMALGRYGKVDEIAGLVAYLAGPEAAFVTGASWKIDGGYTA